MVAASPYPAAGALPDLCQQHGLAAHWLLTEGAGRTINDATGRGTIGRFAGSTPPTWAAGPAGLPCLNLNGSTAYVTFGVPRPLGLARFTLACWFRRSATGVTTTTGTGGVTDIVPLVSHGRGEADGSNLDCNWCMGISDGSDRLACDFEDTATGANHPVTGATTIANNRWYHAAATFDGSALRVYLDGKLDGTATTSTTPRFDSIQHAGLGSALTSAGTAAGFFAGQIADVRIFSRALSQGDVAALAARPYGQLLLPRRRLGSAPPVPMPAAGQAHNLATLGIRPSTVGRAQLISTTTGDALAKGNTTGEARLGISTAGKAKVSQT